MNFFASNACQFNTLGRCCVAAQILVSASISPSVAPLPRTRPGSLQKLIPMNAAEVLLAREARATSNEASHAAPPQDSPEYFHNTLSGLLSA
jgi:hypothetical protein